MSQSSPEKFSKKKYFGFSFLFSFIIPFAAFILWNIMQNLFNNFSFVLFGWFEIIYYCITIILLISLPLFLSLVISLKTLLSLNNENFRWKVILFSFAFALMGLVLIFFIIISMFGGSDQSFTSIIYYWFSHLAINIVFSIISAYCIYKKYKLTIENNAKSN